MSQGDFFELNAWGLSDPAARAYAQAAFDHDLDQLTHLSSIPASWPSKLVDPIHLFACGATRSGGLYASRQTLACLLDQGGQLNAIDASGWVPLSYAAWFGLAGSLDVLLEANADVAPANASPPLFHALSSLAQTDRAGTTTCARLLLMSGADPMSCTINEPYARSSFLSWSLSSDNMDMANLLWAKGDRIRDQKELAVLVWDAQIHALDWLVERGYDVLSCLPQGHEHRTQLALVQSAKKRIALSDIARQHRTANDLGAPGSGPVDDNEEDVRQL